MYAERLSDSPERRDAELAAYLAQKVDWDWLLTDSLLTSDTRLHQSIQYYLVAAGTPRIPPETRISLMEPMLRYAHFYERLPAAPPPETDFSPNLVKDATDWLVGVAECEHFLSEARKQFLYDSSHVLIVGAVALWAKEAGLMYESAEDTICPPQVAAALTRLASTAMQNFDTADREWIAQDITATDQGKRSSMLFIADAFTKNSLLINGYFPSIGLRGAPGWTSQEFDRFPHWFYAGMSGFGFSEQKPFTIGKDGKTYFITGEYCTEGLGSNYPKRHTTIYSKNVYDLARDWTEAKENGRLTFGHELTHFAHRNRIPIAWLRDVWLPAMRSQIDQNGPYARRLRDWGEHQKADREDLCDTVAEFIYKPADLWLQSDARFMAVNQLLRRFDQSLIDAMPNTTSRYIVMDHLSLFRS